jgi:hypothetical protein
MGQRGLEAEVRRGRGVWMAELDARARWAGDWRAGVDGTDGARAAAAGVETRVAAVWLGM